MRREREKQRGKGCLCFPPHPPAFLGETLSVGESWGIVAQVSLQDLGQYPAQADWQTLAAALEIQCGK